MSVEMLTVVLRRSAGPVSGLPRIGASKCAHRRRPILAAGLHEKKVWIPVVILGHPEVPEINKVVRTRSYAHASFWIARDKGRPLLRLSCPACVALPRQTPILHRRIPN